MSALAAQVLRADFSLGGAMRSGAGWLVVITTAAAGVALAQAQPSGMSSPPSAGPDGGVVVVRGYGMSPLGIPILAPGPSDGGGDTSTLSGAGPTVSPGPVVGAGPQVGAGPEIGPDAGIGIR